MTKSIVLMLDRATLMEASEGRSNPMVLAVSEIATVTEFAPRHALIPSGMSIVTTKKKVEHPVLGTPEEVCAKIKAALGETEALTKEPIGTKAVALAEIQNLRDRINGGSAEGWVNQVVYHLDEAADAIKFPPGEKEKP